MILIANMIVVKEERVKKKIKISFYKMNQYLTHFHPGFK